MSTYQELALRTEPSAVDYAAARERADDYVFVRLNHCANGLATEAGEFIDALKKYQYYGRTIDYANLVEELGDVMWYVAIGCAALGLTMEEVQEKNIAKLKARFGDKFSGHAACNRDLDAERAVLDQPTT